MLRTPRPSPVTLSLLALLTTLLVTSALARPTHVLLVLDASGSMYLRLEDGQYRIAAAKDALAQVVSRLPDDPDLDVGLRVYGSRLNATEPDACLDSELVVPIEGFDREPLLRSIEAIEARGATPIAYSLELALEDLRGYTGRAVIVLVTDGAESCGGDVRAAVAGLGEAGLEVDVRIIGFALSEHAIRSFEGLGTFECANSAGELAAALGRAVGVDPDATYPVTVTLTRAGEPVGEGASVHFVDAVDGGERQLTAGADGVFITRLPAGTYRAEVTDAHGATSISVRGLPVTPGDDNAFAFELAPAAEVELVVEPTDPTAGDTVRVRFDGAPAGRGNWLTVVPRDAPDHASFARASVEDVRGVAEVRIPAEQAELEARFHLALPGGGTGVIGRSASFVPQPLTASLAAPAEVAAGTRFEVAWEGPAADGDYVTIVREGTREGMREGDWAAVADGSPVDLLAPPEPGSYEVRYVLRAEHRALVRQPLTVGPADARIGAPAEVAGGGTIEVAWEGPGNPGDYVTIVPRGARDGAFHGTSAAPTEGGSPLTLAAPAEPGDYEVRYVLGQGRRMLVSVPLIVTAAEAGLEVPAEVEAGAAFEVAWVGPDNDGDYLTIVPRGARDGMRHDTSAAHTRDGSPVLLLAPPEPGEHEIRYVLGDGRALLLSVPITVSPTTASIVAPTEVAAGASFEVAWTGPANRGDYLTIVPSGARDGAFHMTSSAQTRDGTRVSLTAPDQAGDYEIRYVLGHGRLKLLSVPIEVR